MLHHLVKVFDIPNRSRTGQARQHFVGQRTVAITLTYRYANGEVCGGIVQGRVLPIQCRLDLGLRYRTQARHRGKRIDDPLDARTPQRGHRGGLRHEGAPGNGHRKSVRLTSQAMACLPRTCGSPLGVCDKSLVCLNQRLRLNQVRSICVNGSIDYGRFMANRFTQGCWPRRQPG
ncbi:hypothetical protein EBI_26314 [Enterocytozoon bieneusi H348]|nr:hypothetical protein EBI_26314 [Enterocytozoon bieneusi H348]|eukprot:XP_002650635.1 hypothetical protein EBI_26314 [Enterocytozoon bieneusi H348]